jgi:hypothetical protein
MVDLAWLVEVGKNVRVDTKSTLETGESGGRDSLWMQESRNGFGQTRRCIR